METLKKNKRSPLKYLEDAIQAFYAKQ
ncbi:MAG: hypothetical protein K1000chlam2_00900, partial [Chlamydiae bacterium]|nr:hypothetical protein [Chlamydiota bacterium]